MANKEISPDIEAKLISLFYSSDGKASPQDIDKFLKENKLDINAKTQDGTSILHIAAIGSSVETFNYLVSKGADVNAKTNGGETVADMVRGMNDVEFSSERAAKINGLKASGKFVDESVSSLRDLRNNIQTVVADSSSLAVTKDNGDIIKVVQSQKSLQENLSAESSQETKYSADRNFVDEVENGNSFAETNLLMHENTHRSHTINNGMHDSNFTPEEQVKISAATEEVACAVQCLNAAYTYTNLKNAGVEEYVYVDKNGVTQSMPVESLLSMFSEELKDHVVENGFDPNKKEDVEAVARISAETFGKDINTHYSSVDGVFDKHGKVCELEDFNENTMYQIVAEHGKESEQYKSTIDNMMKDVVIGQNVMVDLSGAKDALTPMSDDQALEHVLRGTPGAWLDKNEVKQLSGMIENVTEQDIQFAQQYFHDENIKDERSYYNKMLEIHNDPVRLTAYKVTKNEFAQEQLKEELKSQEGALPELSQEDKEKQKRLETKVELADAKKLVDSKNKDNTQETVAQETKQQNENSSADIIRAAKLGNTQDR